MRLKEICELVDKTAPFSISGAYCREYGGYDNSGILVDCGREITGVLFSLDLSRAAAEEAKKRGAQLIVTHHPAIYSPIRSLAQEGEGALVLACVQAGISVISAHLNLDMAEGGIDDCLMRGLGGTKPLALFETPAGGAYGRIFEVEETPLERYAEQVKKTFRTHRLLVYGERPVRRAACFCGAGMTEGSVAFALREGADTFVSSDPKHHLIVQAAEGGMNVLILTHYAAETYGFHCFYERMKASLQTKCAFFADERYL